MVLYNRRSLEFYRGPVVHALLMVRIVPDLVFIGGGVVPFLIGLAHALRNQRPATPIEQPSCDEIVETARPPSSPAAGEMVEGRHVLRRPRAAPYGSVG